jgi:hypothetical protein
VIAVPEADEFADNVPHAPPLHPDPESDQVTPLLDGSFVTVAVACAVAPVCTVAGVMLTETLTAEGVVVIVLPPPPAPPQEVVAVGRASKAIIQNDEARHFMGSPKQQWAFRPRIVDAEKATA